MTMFTQLYLFRGRPSLESQIERFLTPATPNIWAYLDTTLGQARNLQDAVVLLYVATQGEIETGVQTLRKLLLRGIESGELESVNLLNIVVERKPRERKIKRAEINRFTGWSGDAWASKVS